MFLLSRFCVLIMNTRLSIDTLNPIFEKDREENDLSRRIRKAYRNICCPKIYVYHCESVCLDRLDKIHFRKFSDFKSTSRKL